MPACCGSGTACSCRLVAGTGVTISGSGTAADPFVLSADAHISAKDNAQFDVTVAGSGTVASPYTIEVKYAATSKLGDIPNVNAPTPTNGQVLSWNSATSKWVPINPTTAPTGAVTHDGSLTGDGSVGLPLAVVLNSARYLTLFAGSGIGMTDTGINQLVRHFTDASAQGNTTIQPALNTLSMLDTRAGVIQYWTGAGWADLPGPYREVQGPEFLAVSGSYDGISTKTRYATPITATTDASGNMDIIPATALALMGGVLSVQFQETGSQAYKAVVYANVNKISAHVFHLTDGTPWASATFDGIVQAWLY